MIPNAAFNVINAILGPTPAHALQARNEFHSCFPGSSQSSSRVRGTFPPAGHQSRRHGEFGISIYHSSLQQQLGPEFVVSRPRQGYDRTLVWLLSIKATSAWNSSTSPVSSLYPNCQRYFKLGAIQSVCTIPLHSLPSPQESLFLFSIRRPETASHIRSASHECPYQVVDFFPSFGRFQAARLDRNSFPALLFCTRAFNSIKKFSFEPGEDVASAFDS
eukprot:760376-Hanusia_phi.AAC.1